MKLLITRIDDIVVAALSGAVDRQDTGRLYDALVDCVGERGTRLVVDLSGVDRMTRASTRGLIVTAAMLRSSHGAMRICGARAPVAELLRGLGFNHLLKLDRSREAALAELSAAQPSLPPLPASTRQPARPARRARRLRLPAHVAAMTST